MNAAIFSGQGSQYPGMGASFIEADPSLGYVYEAGSDILGFDLKKICLEADKEALSETCHAQPAIMATSIIALEAAKKKGFEYSGVAGHSLGEYAAMYAAGMVTLEEAFRLIRARAAAMDKAAKSSDGKMAAILKISPERVEEICASVEGYVVPVNYNSPVQTVIAGEAAAVEAASELFKAEKARVAPLAVASAFHSAIMQPAADEFAETMGDIDFKEPGVKVYSNVLGAELTDISNIRELLVKHIVSPVRFTAELNAMRAEGFDKFVEFGPGRVLTGLVAKTLKDAAAANCESTETLAAALA